MAVGYTNHDSKPTVPTDNLSTHESHDASSFGEPLIPADSHSELAVLGIPHLETSVTGVEVELLLVTGTIGDMGLSVHTKNLAVGIDDGNGVVVGLVVLLEERDGEHHREFLSNLLEVGNQSAGRSRLSKSERLLLLVLVIRPWPISNLAEIPASEKLLKKDDLGTLSGCLTNELFSLGDVFLPNLAIP